MPFSEIELDAPSGVLEGHGAANEDEGHDNGETHGEVDDSAGQTNAAEDADEDKEPGKGSPSNGLADKLHSWILGVIDDRVARLVAGNRVNVGDDVSVEEFFASSLPWQWVLERVSEVNHDP